MCVEANASLTVTNAYMSMSDLLDGSVTMFKTLQLSQTRMPHGGDIAS
jgi:hypothetical protein